MTHSINRRRFLRGIGAFAASVLTFSAYRPSEGGRERKIELASATVDKITESKFTLPDPVLKGKLSLEEVIFSRRSRRKFSSKPITLEQLSQLLWAAQGITSEEQGIKLRSAPSAGALYPMDIYAVLPTGVYRYQPRIHGLERITKDDRRISLAIAALAQEFIAAASVNIVITAEYERSMIKYERRGVRYSIIEAGNISQNIYLQAEALRLSTVAVGAFDDGQVQKALNLPKRHRPLLIMPVGYPR
ncbi:MAG: SagB family peptide dehydrogenase [Candidatus Poribacteria bacterium]